MRTWICIGILALCSLSCGEDVAQPQAPPAPTIDDLVLANMLAVQAAAESLAADQGGRFDYDTYFLYSYLPGGDKLTNPVTGQATDPVFFEPDGVGSTSYRGVWHYDYVQDQVYTQGYVIIGRGESGDITITNAPDSLVQLDVLTVENCYIVQAAAEAFAADNNGVYAVNGSSVNPLGKRLTDYLPGGMLLMNYHSGTRSEPNWAGLAACDGCVGYLSIDTNGDLVMDGYNIDGIGGNGYTQIIFICGGTSYCD